jgi:hypothetical protein
MEWRSSNRKMEQGVVMKYASVGRENWDGDGCSYEVSVVPGDYDALIVELSKVTKGEFQFNIDGAAAQAMAATTEDDDKKGKKSKGKGK